MPLSKKPWGSIDKSDYADPAAYCRACLIDMNPEGAEKKKELCKLPVREPGGMLNMNGMKAAQGALLGARGGLDAPADEKKAAARKLARIMMDNDMEPAEGMMQMAGMMQKKG